MTFRDLGTRLADQARVRPDAPALIFHTTRGSTSLTFDALHRLSDRYAAGFEARGIRRGDRTLVLVKPSPEFYAALFGLIKTGAIPVLVDPGMGLRNVLACVEEIRPEAMVALSAVHAIRMLFRRPFRSVRHVVTVGRRWFWGGPRLEDCLGPDEPYPPKIFSPDDEVGIVFTSGSTGTPKGVTYTHRVFDGVARLAGSELGREAGRTILETFAAFVLFDIVQGMTAVIPEMDLSRPAKADPAKLVAAIVDHHPSAAFASPVVLEKIVARCRREGLSLSSLRDVVSAVAPVPPRLHRELAEIAPGATLHVAYGATEGMTVTHVNSPTILEYAWERTRRGEGTCVGRPFSEMKVYIVPILDEPIPEWSPDLTLPPGDIGEVVIGGPVVSPSYKERPQANAHAKIRDGDHVLHRTGDLGTLDDEGRLWFCGRKSHRVTTARGMLPSVPLEGIFDEHPDVRRTALVGLGPPGEQRPILVVEPRTGVRWTPDHSRDVLRMAEGTRWEGRVDDVVLTREFPVDARHNAKIRREELQSWITMPPPRPAPADNPRPSPPKEAR